MGGFPKPILQTTGNSDPVVYDIAKTDKVSWYRKRNLRYLYLMLLPTCMGIEITSGFDSQLINALQIVPTWIKYFNNPQGSLKGIIAAAYPLGAVLSLPFVPIVNERLGRRWSILLGSLVMCVGAIVQGFAQNTSMYIVARCILGFGIPTCIVSGSSLIGELGYPKERPVLTSLFNVAYFIGQLVAAGIAFGTNNITSNWAWRIPSLLQIAPSLLQISFVFFLPESPRWLITQDRSEEAFEILTTYHAEGDRDSEFVRAEMAQIKTTIHLEYEASKQSWLSLLTSAGMRRRFLVSSFLGLFTQWSGNTLISYYLGDILQMIGRTNPIFKQKLNVGLSAWGLIVGFSAAMLVPHFRRRTLYLACTISLLVVYICWTVTMQQSIVAKESKNPNEAAGIATIFFIFLYSPCYNLGYNALTYTYLVEIWPYAMRSRGIASFQFFGRMANFFTTFVNPIGLKNISWKWLITYCCWLAFEVVFVWFFFPETSNRTLEELAFMFEDKALADKAVEAVEKVVHHEDMDPVTVEPKQIEREQVEIVEAASNPPSKV